MNSRYQVARGLRGYLAGATAARAGDEMSGPALLPLGFAVTGRPAAGSGLLASVTIAGAVGGPVFGALLDRSSRPDRVPAWALAGLATPAAGSLARYGPGTPDPAAPDRPALRRQMAGGFAVIAARRPLRRATVTSAVSYAGIGMLLTCCPVLGAQRLGGPARGALLISAMAVASLAANGVLARKAARSGSGRPEILVITSTLVMGAGMAAAAAPGWLTLAAVALAGAGEGPQLTALFADRKSVG